MQENVPLNMYEVCIPLNVFVHFNRCGAWADTETEGGKTGIICHITGT